MSRLMTVLAFLTAILVTLTGCSLSPASTVSLPEPTATISIFPWGIYHTDHNKLKIEPDHFTISTQFDQELVQGNYSVDGNRVTFTETKFVVECKPEDSPYSYQWSFDGKDLVFSEPQDKCLNRVYFLTDHPWVIEGGP